MYEILTDQKICTDKQRQKLSFAMNILSSEVDDVTSLFYLSKIASLCLVDEFCSHFPQVKRNNICEDSPCCLLLLLRLAPKGKSLAEK